MKKAPTPKLTLSVAVLLLAMIAAIGGTVAVYTSQVFQRSVVRNRDTEAIRFSSDKLYRVLSTNGELAAQKYYYPTSEGQQTMSFTVCNYDQSKSTVFSEKDIAYSIVFNVKNAAGEVEILRNDSSFQAGKSHTLKGGGQSKDTYTIRFSEADYNTLEVAVTVTPTDPTLTKNTMLQATLIPIQYATTQGLTVKSEFTDSTRGGPDQFDAYNLSVTISGGKGDVLILWDAEKLDIDPFFMDGKTVGTDPETGYTTLTVPMDSEDETCAYLVQFYNHNSTKPNWKTWDQVPIKVRLVEPPTTP